MINLEPVSVVITCYNLERYVGAAIDSVIAQEYGGDVEIIVVDDCSTDRSLDVVKRYRGVDVVPLLRNGGVLNAMLAGIQRASHDIVMLLDGDDIWDSTKVRETAEAFGKDAQVALVTHDLRYVDGDGDPIDRHSRVGERFQDVNESACSDLLIEGILSHRDYVWLGSALSFRKSRCEIDRFREFCEALPDAQNTYQDWPLAYWIASIPGVRLAIIKRVLFSYRLHGQNYSGDATTIVKAVRNSKRTLNTARAMQCIAVIRKLDKATLHGTSDLVNYCTFVFLCYSGRRADIAYSFAQSIQFVVRQRNLIKELARLFSFVLLSRGRALLLLNSVRECVTRIHFRTAPRRGKAVSDGLAQNS